jgi:hypothetical protein
MGPWLPQCCFLPNSPSPHSVEQACAKPGWPGLIISYHSALGLELRAVHRWQGPTEGLLESALPKADSPGW